MRYNKEEPESLEYRGINSMRNMVIMRRAIHRAFDAHEITVDPEVNLLCLPRHSPCSRSRTPLHLTDESDTRLVVE
ncbi:hypothetical protein SISSUDRAFT_1046411 [Sistotremastrum suecicum HHB10207 ss-3]|uniref:HNH nuclease domain-containing protein n=1 Tax=Sistotremastrum suecicum HHB10207 ss-3 TaxID=1314776 RepID=A0A166DRE3_9AGAM|nr:hypothetical protein SISSUDRAFT_1046411 [Sistotremastrum suecicum HHB10207 ss-3]